MNKALMLEKTEEGSSLSYQCISLPNLTKGEVRIKVRYSGINYKDRLAVKAETKVVRMYPMVPGIDFSGEVEASESDKFRVGEHVFVTGFGYGTDRAGGFQEMVTVKEEHLVRIPENMDPMDVMIYGTAGFTAALSVEAMVKALGPLEGRTILVTGGSGGVSSLGILLLHQMGAVITAATTKLENTEYLKSLGAREVILFDSLLEKRKALSAEKWDAVLDAAGGAALGNILTEVKYGGIVCTSGNLSGIRFDSTVFPFILRGITLKGIDSVMADDQIRKDIFDKLAGPWKSSNLRKTVQKVISFQEVKEELLKPYEGTGRILVDMHK